MHMPDGIKGARLRKAKAELMNQDAKPFRAVVFDWDGTAVTDRAASAVDLLRMLEPLLRRGVICVIVTGTNFENIERQATRFFPSWLKCNLYVATNRGSEVHGFTSEGEIQSLWLRKCTRREEAALDEAVEKTRTYVAAQGVPCAVIANRMNRRKLDLYPEEPWLDPKKAQLTELLQAVSDRLCSHALAGGLAGVVKFAEDAANNAGLNDPRVTSDVKHVEIGLTDKGDSVRWIVQNVLEPRGIGSDEVVVFGDEFGRLGGVSGSDSRMLIAELRMASFVSVGREPEGVPAGVMHLGGGPQAFLLFLARQTSTFSRSVGGDLHGTGASDPAWRIEQVGFDGSRERDMETIFAIGNGYLGLRGGVELPIATSRSDLYVAGVFGRKAKEHPYSEEVLVADDRDGLSNVELVPLPFPLGLDVKIGDTSLTLASERLRTFRRSLDMASGIVTTSQHFDGDPGGAATLTCRRAAPMHLPHLLAQDIVLSSTAPDELVVFNTDVGAESPNWPWRHLKRESPAPPPGVSGVTCYEADGSGIVVVVAWRLRLDEEDCPTVRATRRLPSGGSCRLQRMVAIYTSRDTEDPLVAACDLLKAVTWREIDQMMAGGAADLWSDSWSRMDTPMPSAPEVSQVVRFNAFNLRIAIDHDPEVSVAARSLSGRAYEGHVFWDTDVFAFPFYLHTFPELARSLLAYRHRTLPGARRRAVGMGCRGACYAWESTTTGDDVTPRMIHIPGRPAPIPIFTGSQQIHVTAGVAHAIWSYWQMTRDDAFMRDFGVEILVETARFWRTRVVERKGRLHIERVVGPDEYHHDVTDNAYTNWMARFNLDVATRALAWLERSDGPAHEMLRTNLDLAPDESASWLAAAEAIYIPGPDDDGIIEQFAGFRNLPSVEEAEERFHPPIARLFEWERVNSLQICKQADVLMIPFLFPDAWSARVLAANFAYYERLTDHGSSLSPAVHAALAARLGLKEKSETYWRQALQIDLLNLMGNVSLGFHVACAGAVWQALVFHMLGLTTASGELVVPQDAASRLPSEARDVRVRFARLNRWFDVDAAGVREVKR